MNKPQSNGLVELVDEKQLDSRAWNCMDLIGFMFDDETTKGWEVA